MKNLLSISLIASLVLALLPTLSRATGFTDVRPNVTPYAEAIINLQDNAILEGYRDGSFKPSSRINRAEFLKIILESRGGEFEGEDCFPDVRDEWFAKYVCTAVEEGIVEGYPNGRFSPEKAINFVEAAKIVSLAYEQDIESYPDWYEGFVRALEGSKAIPLSIEELEQRITRGEMAEIMWRLRNDVSDQPSKGYLNVKYPEISVNVASDEPQRATSCRDIEAFARESARQYGRYDYLMEDEAVMAMPMARTTAGVAADAQSKSFSDTNVQVAGVDEADQVKTDGTYVYTIENQNVRIVRAHPASTMKVESTLSFADAGFNPQSLYLDDNRLIIIGSRWRQASLTSFGDRLRIASLIMPPYYGGSQTEVRIYDISDRSDPNLKRTLTFDGSEISTRRIGSKLYLVMNEQMHYTRPIPLPIPLERELLPTYSDSAHGNTERAVVGCDDVVILPHEPRPSYLIVAVIPTDSDTKDVSKEVVLGSAQNIYSSLENLYIAAVQHQYHWRGGFGTNNQKTSIYRFAYEDDGISMKAHGSVPGSILNQFSMDEHDGHFRIATTQGNMWDDRNPSTSNIFVLNRNLETVGEIRDIAPGERIYSARFMGDRGYLVTFKKVDPFFAIDLSSPRNPRILGKLKIPGYSDYLHPYDEDHIIGFGKEAVEAKGGDFAWYQGMKMAIFDVRDPQNPIERQKFVIGDRGTESPLLHNHKALLFDRDRNLLAFPVQVHQIPESQKDDPEGNAWGEAVYQGAYVFDIDLRDGFTIRGRITHYDDQDFLKSGSYFYGKSVERILRIEDSLITISQDGIQSHDERDIEYENGIRFSEPTPIDSGICPDKEDAGVRYVSDDPGSCATIRFFCEDDEDAFSNSCGCGCVQVD